MPVERYGVTILDDAEAKDMSNAAVKAVSEVNLGDVRFPFGFFIKEDGGKKFVVPATLEDKMKVLRTAFSDYPDLPPDHESHSCNSHGGSTCSGGCGKLPSGYMCRRVSHPASHFYGCACVDLS